GLDEIEMPDAENLRIAGARHWACALRNLHRRVRARRRLVWRLRQRARLPQHRWRAMCDSRSIEHRRIRPYTPRTNGKVERFNRTLLDEWAYARLYRSNGHRLTALARWLHNYNHHRCHTALGGHPPMTRVNNLAG